MVGGLKDASNTKNTGAFHYDSTKGWYGGNANTAVNQFTTIDFDASRSNTIYGNANTVTPLSLSTKFFIKY